jgi:hypothetical protein
MTNISQSDSFLLCETVFLLRSGVVLTIMTFPVFGLEHAHAFQNTSNGVLNVFSTLLKLFTLTNASRFYDLQS